MAFPAHAMSFASRLGAKYPIVLAPMLGNTTPQLAAAAANAGAMGFEAGGTHGKEILAAKIQEARALLNKDAVYGVNLFVPSGFYVDAAAWTPAQAAAVKTAVDRHNAWLEELTGKAPAAAPEPSLEEMEAIFRGQVDAIIDNGVKLVSFMFGWPASAEVARLHASGATLVGCATTVAEAKWLVEQGADAVIAQGAEAGGHRGTFLDTQNYRSNALVSTVPLVRNIAEAVDVPIIAAGGIMDGADIAAVLEAGASAAQMGTAFLSCPECNTHPLHREALLSFGGLVGGSRSEPAPTSVTKVYTGKPARGIRTARAERMSDLEESLPNCFNAMMVGRTLQGAAMTAERADAAFLWAGMGYPKSRAMPLAELIATLAAEVAAVGSRL